MIELTILLRRVLNDCLLQQNDGFIKQNTCTQLNNWDEPTQLRIAQTNYWQRSQVIKWPLISDTVQRNLFYIYVKTVVCIFGHFRLNIDAMRKLKQSQDMFLGK